MQDDADPRLEEARAAARESRWGDAFRILKELDAEHALGPEALELLAEVAWWDRRLDEDLGARERAAAGYLTEGRTLDAARVAVAAAKENFDHRQLAIARGWQARAERLLENEPESVVHGHLERLRSYIAFERDGDVERGLAHADESLRIARSFGDRSLEAVAAHDRARILIAAGRVHEGLELLDEAMTSALTGELDPRSRGVVYCNMIRVCDQLADYGRAAEWTDAARRWCEDAGATVYPGVCRIFRASLLRMRGVLDEAEREARDAFRELEPVTLASALPGLVEIGVILVTIGDLDGAADVFAKAEELGASTLPGSAQLALARGEARAAYTALRDGLVDAPDELRRARLLPTYVAASCEANEIESASRAAAELAAIAERFDTPALHGRAAAARGAVALATGDATTAEVELRRASKLLRDAGAVLESAESRVALGRALSAAGRADDGLRAIEDAATTLERHGARPAADRARALLSPGEQRPARARRTFIFTDICSSTDLVAAIGDDAWRDLVGWHDRTLRESVGEFGGEEVKALGDGFFLAFPSPQAALACAVSMQRRLAGHRREHGFAPRVRIGVHVADADADAGDYRGRGVNEAARIGALAGADEIVASRATVDEAGDGIRTSAARSASLKGIPEPVEIVTIDWS